jgi:hypothetical protein
MLKATRNKRTGIGQYDLDIPPPPGSLYRSTRQNINCSIHNENWFMNSIKHYTNK